MESFIQKPKFYVMGNIIFQLSIQNLSNSISKVHEPFYEMKLFSY